MQEIDIELTEAANIITSLRYAIEKGHIKLDMTSFQGWQDNCNCLSCKSQRIVFDALLAKQVEK